MSTFAKLLAEDQRLLILQLLVEADGYGLSTEILSDAAAAVARPIPLDDLHEHIRWLAARDLVRADLVGDTALLTVTVTARGIDVAHGRGRAPGVKRPALE